MAELTIRSGRTRVADATYATVRACKLNLAACVFLQRIVVPLGSEAGISFILPIAGTTVVFLIIYHRAYLELIRFFFAYCFVAAAIGSQLLTGKDFSLNSLALLILMYSVLSIQAYIRPQEYIDIIGFYIWCCCIVALLGIAQLMVQLAGWNMPILEDFTPSIIIARDFNHIQEISYGSGLYKPNGMFMLEASFLSQYIAIAVVLEYFFLRRFWVLMILSAGLIISFSGTGLALAFVSMIVIVIARGIDRMVIWFGIGTGALLFALAVAGYLDPITSRLEEFSRPESSADLRFLAPYSRAHDFLTRQDDWTVLTGAGAGVIDVGPGFAWNPPVKILVEYGVVVLFFFILMLISLVRGPVPSLIKFTLAAEYLFFGGGALLQPSIVFLCYFLGVGYSFRSTRPPATKSTVKEASVTGACHEVATSLGRRLSSMLPHA